MTDLGRGSGGVEERALGRSPLDFVYRVSAGAGPDNGDVHRPSGLGCADSRTPATKVPAAAGAGRALLHSSVLCAAVSLSLEPQSGCTDILRE